MPHSDEHAAVISTDTVGNIGFGTVIVVAHADPAYVEEGMLRLHLDNMKPLLGEIGDREELDDIVLEYFSGLGYTVYGPAKFHFV